MENFSLYQQKEYYEINAKMEFCQKQNIFSNDACSAAFDAKL